MTRRPIAIVEETQVNTIPDSDASLNLDLFAHSVEALEWTPAFIDFNGTVSTHNLRTSIKRLSY